MSYTQSDNRGYLDGIIYDSIDGPTRHLRSLTLLFNANSVFQKLLINSSSNSSSRYKT